MINAGIDDGDLVLIRKQETAREGQIVAFLYDSAATTLKRYEPSGESITLRPENEEMSPIVIHGDDRANLRIQGVATMVIKSLESGGASIERAKTKRRSPLYAKAEMPLRQSSFRRRTRRGAPQRKCADAPARSR